MLIAICQKKDIIYALIRSKPAINEEKYISYLNKDTNNVIHNEINKIRIQLFDISQYLSKKLLYDTRKKLYDFEKLTKINRSLYHDQLGSNPERITEKLSIYTQAFNWDETDFPASYEDYAIFEKLNEDIALNILYVPFNKKDIHPEYISERNFTTKKQIILLKITDNKDKWHFLAIPSISCEDGVKRPPKSFSRLMEGIASKSHGDFYCYGCLHSFSTLSTLKNHVELCKYNKFCKIEPPKEDKNVKQYAPDAKSLPMNSVIYADFESILLPYSTCDKEDVTTKKLNKQVPCGYSINVITNHNK